MTRMEVFIYLYIYTLLHHTIKKQKLKTSIVTKLIVQGAAISY